MANQTRFDCESGQKIAQGLCNSQLKVIELTSNILRLDESLNGSH